MSKRFYPRQWTFVGNKVREQVNGLEYEEGHKQAAINEFLMFLHSSSPSPRKCELHASVGHRHASEVVKMTKPENKLKGDLPSTFDAQRAAR
jgi:hypothetical protein